MPTYNVSHEPLVVTWGEGLVYPGDAAPEGTVPTGSAWSDDAKAAKAAGKAYRDYEQILAVGDPVMVSVQAETPEQAADPVSEVPEVPATPVTDAPKEG